MQSIWYYRMTDGSRRGPVPHDILAQLYSDNLIPETTLVCMNDENSWREIRDIPEFNNSSASALPPIQATQYAAQVKPNKNRNLIKWYIAILLAFCLAVYLVPIGLDSMKKLTDPVYAQVDDKLNKIYGDIQVRTGNKYKFEYLGRHWSGTEYQFKVYLYRMTVQNGKDFGDKKLKSIVFVFAYLDKETNTWKCYGEKNKGLQTIAHSVDLPDELVDTISVDNKNIIEEKEKFIRSVLVDRYFGATVDEIAPVKM